MIKTKFIEVANEIGGEYKLEKRKVASWGGSNIAIDIHELRFIYHSVLIMIIYDFGNTNLAEVSCGIEMNKKMPEFLVETKNQIKRLFSVDRSPFKIKSNDPFLIESISKALVGSKYQDLAKETTFEPEIKGFREAQLYRINTKFYVGFDKKELSILPTIIFYKTLIDELI